MALSLKIFCKLKRNGVLLSVCGGFLIFKLIFNKIILHYLVNLSICNLEISTSQVSVYKHENDSI